MVVLLVSQVTMECLRATQSNPKHLSHVQCAKKAWEHEVTLGRPQGQSDFHDVEIPVTLWIQVQCCLVYRNLNLYLYPCIPVTRLSQCYPYLCHTLVVGPISCMMWLMGIVCWHAGSCGCHCQDMI
jgi:hypothetical protein